MARRFNWRGRPSCPNLVTKTNVSDYLERLIEPSARTATDRKTAKPANVHVDVVQLLTVEAHERTSSSDAYPSSEFRSTVDAIEFIAQYAGFMIPTV